MKVCKTSLHSDLYTSQPTNVVCYAARVSSGSWISEEAEVSNLYSAYTSKKYCSTLLLDPVLIELPHKVISLWPEEGMWCQRQTYKLQAVIEQQRGMERREGTLGG